MQDYYNELIELAKKDKDLDFEDLRNLKIEVANYENS